MADIERHFPGIADAVARRGMSTAETMHDYVNAPGDAPPATEAMKEMRRG
jgi:hypothetical protein